MAKDGVASQFILLDSWFVVRLFSHHIGPIRPISSIFHDETYKTNGTDVATRKTYNQQRSYHAVACQP
jgi:hypothetical protein